MVGVKLVLYSSFVGNFGNAILDHPPLIDMYLYTCKTMKYLSEREGQSFVSTGEGDGMVNGLNGDIGINSCIVYLKQCS